MLLSIIVATKGRVLELEALLNSIEYSRLDLVEIIIVDQNVGEILNDVLMSFRNKLNIIHLKCDALGAANARNIGIDVAKGKYLCFPDDDCKFMRNTILIALKKIENFDVLFGKCVDENGADSVINFSRSEAILTMGNYSNKFVEATMFTSRVIMLNFPYDNKLGVGTFHGAEEAFDLVLRLLKSNKKILYTPEVQYFHPNKILNYGSESEIRRVFTYRCGFAKLCMKHKLYSKYFNRLILIGLSIPFFLVFNRKKSRYYLAEFLGLIAGIVIK